MASDLITTIRDIIKAAPGYTKAEKYYNGTVTEVFSSERITKLVGKNAALFKVNIAKRPVTALMNRLEIDSVAVEDDDDTDTSDDPTEEEISPLQRALDQAWKDLELNLEIPDVIAKALRYGDAYLAYGEDEQEQMVVFVREPHKLRAFYDPNNNKALRWFGETWLTDDKHRRVVLYYRDRTEHYISLAPEEAGGTLYEDSAYRPFASDPNDPESTVIDYTGDERWPFYHLRTDRPYGVPMHSDVYGTQNMLTKQVAILMDATDGYGLPFRYALRELLTSGQPAAVRWDDDDDEPEIPDGPRIKSEPGSIAQLSNIKTVGQLQPADINNLLEPIDMILRMSALVSDTQLSYFAPSSDVSGVSRREDEKPFVKKVERLQTLMEGVFSRFLEDVMTDRGYPKSTVRITWAPAELVDESERWAIVKAKTDAGLPLKQALIEAGYTSKAAERFLAQSGEQQYSQRVELFLKLSQVAQNLGAAEELGVWDEGTAKQVMASLLTDLTSDEDEQVADGHAVDPAE